MFVFLLLCLFLGVSQSEDNDHAYSNGWVHVQNADATPNMKEDRDDIRLTFTLERAAVRFSSLSLCFILLLVRVRDDTSVRPTHPHVAHTPTHTHNTHVVQTEREGLLELLGLLCCA